MAVDRAAVAEAQREGWLRNVRLLRLRSPATLLVLQSELAEGRLRVQVCTSDMCRTNVREGSNLRIRERQFAPILLFCKKPDDLGER